MPIAGGGPIRRWAEALRRLSTPGNRLDNVACNKLGTQYSKNQSEKVFPSMSPAELIASIRERRRRSEQQSCEEGALLRRRLQELLAVPASSQSGGMPPSTQTVKQMNHHTEA
jgi:hypothetical protein